MAQRVLSAEPAMKDNWFGVLALMLGLLAAAGAAISSWCVVLAFAGGFLATSGHRRLAEGSATNRGVLTAAGVVNAVVVGLTVWVAIGGNLIGFGG